MVVAVLATRAGRFTFLKERYFDMSILSWIILGLIAGFIGSKIVNKSGQGMLLDIVLGIVGSVVGGYLFSAFGGTGVTGLNIWSLIVAVIGGRRRARRLPRGRRQPLTGDAGVLARDFERPRRPRGRFAIRRARADAATLHLAGNAAISPRIPHAELAVLIQGYAPGGRISGPFRSAAASTGEKTYGAS